VQRGVAWWWPIALYVVAFMLILAGHFIFSWNVKWVLLIAALGVALISSHLLKL
jgi:hypothetical protein